jgi:hypothetical protein
MPRRANRFDGAGELGQEPVAGMFDDAAPVFRNGWLDNIRQKRGQACMRALFVVMHQPRITGYVCGHYCRQPPSDPL